MKILFIAHDSLQAGSGKCLYELLNILRKQQELTPVVLTHAKNDLYEALQSLGIETYSFRYGFTFSWTQSPFWTLIKKIIYRPFFNRLSYFKLKRKLDLKTIDLVHSNSGVIDFGAYLARKLQVKHVWHLREFGKLDFNLNYLIKDFPEYVEKNSNKVVCVSKVMKEYYRGEGITKLLTIYDGVVGADFNNRNTKTSDGLVKICMCGRLSAAKGQHWAIEALTKLSPQTVKNIRLDFWGTGSALNSLREQVYNVGLEKQVSFRGFSSKLHEELPNYDIGLNLSRAEGFGRTTVEYMLSGLFVIGNNTGATPEILGEGKFGILVPYGDTKTLANAIASFVNNPAEYKSIAEKGQLYARENFTIEKNAVKFLELYRQILG